MTDMEFQSLHELQRVFYQGRCDEIVAATVDHPYQPIEDASWPLIIGSLSFLGRTVEAELRFKEIQPRLKEEAKVAARFYLGIGFTRASSYAKARSYFISNLHSFRRHERRPLMAFYTWQGAGFYHYFCGRFSLALVTAERALAAAIRDDFFFGRMLATDLVGHVRVETGEIARGLSELKMAHRFAQSLGHGSFAKAIDRAIVCYRAQYGLAAEETIRSLQSQIQQARVQDNYTDNYLILELIRQLTLQGRLQEAEELLHQVSRSIYATQHRRQKVLVNLRWAELAYLRRDQDLLHDKLRLAESDMDPEVDSMLRLQWLGMALKSQWTGRSGISDDLRSLTRRTGSGWARRIAARNMPSSAQHPMAPGDDPLGDLLDRLSDPKLKTMERISKLISSSYLGLLIHHLPIETSDKLIYLHLTPKILLLYRRGDISVSDSGKSPKILDLLRVLAKGHHTKEALVAKVWGYRYQPLRHDALLYNLVSRLRAALGDCADWLVNTSDGYELEEGVKIVIQQPEVMRQPPKQSLPHLALADMASADLNARQISILNHLESRPWIAIDDCVTLFNTSKVTATRDLSALVKAGLVVRIGKGRATRYAAPSSGSSHMDSSHLGDVP